MSRTELVIVGARGGTNVGQSLYDGAHARGLRVTLIDTALAWSAPRLLRAAAWRFLSHRPVRLGRFSAHVVAECRRLRPTHLLAVGLAPVASSAVRTVRALGVRTVDFLTDDPWNPALTGAWALRALAEYERLASPRRANLQELAALGCDDVRYVPFGFDPSHCLVRPGDADPSLGSDVIFVGGADADRAPWLATLIDAGLDVAIYGSYWDRYPGTRGRSRGQADPLVIRRATAAAKVALCLVRRANRDGHVMRSLEIPATGACMLVEDTAEHRALFGPDGETVTYFGSPSQMLERARWLLAHTDERTRLATAAQARIVGGKHTYADRLDALLADL